MDLSFLMDYSMPVIVGICLCLGYVIKESLDFIPNKYIPLIMAVIGVGINLSVQQTFTPEMILSGMFSGLVSTGLYEMFRNLIDGKK